MSVEPIRSRLWKPHSIQDPVGSGSWGWGAHREERVMAGNRASSPGLLRGFALHVEWPLGVLTAALSTVALPETPVRSH